MLKPTQIMTQNNNYSIDDFLQLNGLKGAVRKALAGDASNRRYERIITSDRSYMLMIAPPGKEDVRPFVKVDRILRQNNLHAPEIYAEDAENGYLLLEDMGDDLFSRVLINNNNELELYKLAIEVLEKLPNNADLPFYSTEKLLEESALFIDWFATNASRDEFLGIVANILSKLDNSQPKLVLRDYHADNLMWLPQYEGLQRVGLLDFQDAVIGHAAYDLVSLLEDARRDVTEATKQELLKNKSADFMRDYFILGAQRNLKIIGIFNRLKKRDNKDAYLKFLPRVWAHFKGDLQHPVMAELKAWINKNNLLPE